MGVVQCKDGPPPRVSECVSALFRNEHFDPNGNVFRRFACASAIGMLHLRGAALVSDLHAQIGSSLAIWETPAKIQKPFRRLHVVPY
jgi:hypothetical protein